MATIKVLNVAQANPEAPVQIKLGVVNEPEKPIQYVGIPGPQGPKGETGARGPQGLKGDTPVKGVDYFTAQDIADIAAQVPAADLTGYATESYVTTALAGLETGVLKREIVVNLPVTNIDTNTIYMQAKAGDNGTNNYDEYLYINGNWEHIGSTDVDLISYRPFVELQYGNGLLDDGSLTTLRNIRNSFIQLNYVDGGIMGVSTFSATDIFINKKPIDYVSATELSGGIYKLYFYSRVNGEYLKRDVFTWQDNQDYLGIASPMQFWGGELKLPTINRLSNQSVTIGDNFSYIKNNYATKSELAVAAPRPFHLIDLIQQENYNTVYVGDRKQDAIDNLKQGKWIKGWYCDFTPAELGINPLYRAVLSNWSDTAVSVQEAPQNATMVFTPNFIFALDGNVLWCLKTDVTQSFSTKLINSMQYVGNGFSNSGQTLGGALQELRIAQANSIEYLTNTDILAIWDGE